MVKNIGIGIGLSIAIVVVSWLFNIGWSPILMLSAIVALVWGAFQRGSTSAPILNSYADQPSVMFEETNMTQHNIHKGEFQTHPENITSKRIDYVTIGTTLLIAWIALQFVW